MKWLSQRDVVVAYWGYTVAMLIIILVLALGQSFSGNGESVFYLLSGLLLGTTLRRVW